MTTGIVTTSPLVRQYTLEEFWDLPAPEKGGHHELIAGVLYMVPPPSDSHNEVISRLNLLLASYLVNHPGTGKLYVPRAPIWVQERTHLEPDLMYVSMGRLPPGGIGHLRSADLVIEAFSAATAVYDQETKADTYAALGVRELWLVDLSRQEIEQRVLEAGAWRALATARPGETLHAQVLPGFTVNVADIFAGLPRE